MKTSYYRQSSRAGDTEGSYEAFWELLIFQALKHKHHETGLWAALLQFTAFLLLFRTFSENHLHPFLSWRRVSYRVGMGGWMAGVSREV